MRTRRRRAPSEFILAPLLLCLAVAAPAAAQSITQPATQTPTFGTCIQRFPPQQATPDPFSQKTSGISITVVGSNGQYVSRKRFYLLERKVNFAGAPSREDFLKGASPELRAWLKKYDCDTLYCQRYQAGYDEAVKTVPEFRAAYETGLKKYGNPRLAMKWIMVNFPLKEARTAYYDRKRAWVARALREGGLVTSAMTDDRGHAVFTNLRLRTYRLTNLVPLEEGRLLWDCEVTVPPPNPRQLYSAFFSLDPPKAPASAGN